VRAWNVQLFANQIHVARPKLEKSSRWLAFLSFFLHSSTVVFFPVFLGILSSRTGLTVTYPDPHHILFLARFTKITCTVCTYYAAPCNLRRESMGV